MSKQSEAKRKRREARKQAGWHPIADWYRATSGVIVPGEAVCLHQIERKVERFLKLRARGYITAPDHIIVSIVRRFGETTDLQEQVQLRKALDEATRRGKKVANVSV